MAGKGYEDAERRPVGSDKAKEKITAGIDEKCLKNISLLSPQFHKTATSKRHSLGMRKVSKQGRKNLKSQQKFQDIDDLVDEGMNFDLDNDAERSTTETVSTARPDISAARPEVSTAEPKTPPTTTTLFNDEDVTIADTLVKMKNQKSKEKGIAFKDADDSTRPIRSITTLQPLPTIDPKDKDLNEEARTERERQEEASKVALAEMYDEVVPYDDKAIDYETLDVKSLIVDGESQVLGTNEAGDVHVYKLTILDGSYRHFSAFSKMLKFLVRKDVLDLHKIVMERFPNSDLEGLEILVRAFMVFDKELINLVILDVKKYVEFQNISRLGPEFYISTYEGKWLEKDMRMFKAGPWDLFDTYGEVFTLKRSRDDKDKDQDPSAGSDRGTKRKNLSKDAESSRDPKSKDSKSTSSSKGTSRSQRKSSGKSAMQKSQVIQLVTQEMGDNNEQPDDEVASKVDWFKKPEQPPTPDPDWNKRQHVDFRPPQTWISNIARAENPPTSFDEIMDTPIDFSAFVMNRLHNPEGKQYPVDLRNLLLLIPNHRGHHVIPFDYFINNDLEYRKGGSLSKNYSTSVTKTKAATYEVQWIEYMVPNIWIPKRQQFYGFASNMMSSKDVYSRKRIIAITSITIMKRYDYGHLDEIKVRREDQQLCKFKEDERFDLNVALRMFTRHIVIQRRVEDLQLERERKARTTLLMAIPEDHLEKFHKITDAKEMWEAIKSRFGGNDESKKMQKYILKQQFEGFSVSNSEGLHKGYDRFQSIMSQLKIHGVGVSTEDANQKFLRSLPSSWSQVSLIMRTKPRVDTLSFDDLYNNLKVFDSDVKGSTTSSSSRQNVAFVSSDSTNSTNENVAFVSSDSTNSTNEVSTAYGVSTSSGRNSQKEGSSSYTHDLMYTFFANQSSGPQLDHEDLEQVDEFDLEEMDLKWQVAMISTRLKKFYKKIGRKLHFDAKEPVGFDKTKIDRSSDAEDSHVNDRFAKVEGMHVVPPPMTGIYMPLKSNFGIDKSKFTYGPKQSKTSESDVKTSNLASCESNSSVETLESKPKAVSEPKVWFDAPIIEEYESKNDDEYVFKASVEQEKPSCAFINTVQHVKTPRQTVKDQDTCSHNPKVPKRDWIGLMSKRLGLGYGYTRKACFACGSFSHLIRDYDFHEKIMAKQVELNKRKNKDNPHQNLKVKGIVDSGCSRHMTGNKAYLIEYQDLNGGPVAFGDIECLVLSPDFKLPDEIKYYLDAARPSYPDLSTFGNQDNSQIPSLEDTYEVLNDGILTSASYDDEGAVADFTNLESTMNKKVIRTKWVYRNKKDERGVVVRNKARFYRSYVPKEGLQSCKALYDLHQALRAWYATLSTFLVQSRYRKGLINKTLFINKDKKDIMLVQVYVDDIIFGSTKKSWCDKFEVLMKSRTQISSMGELTFFLGLHVKQKKDGIFISQDKYVVEILKKFDFMSVKTASTLIETKKPLVKDAEAADVDVHLYRSMIGSLMYLTASRPNIIESLGISKANQNWVFGILESQPLTWKPTHIVTMLEQILIGNPQQEVVNFLWQYKKQTILATSTTEAEYVAVASCCVQVLWIQNQMLDYGFNFINIKIYIDNESTICIVKNLVFHFKTKHIEITHHFIRDAYEKKLILALKIHTDDNVADLLTKAFDVSRFNFLVVNNGMLNL
uniref:Reverse transcriptase Ty1/copia-type domain-containing protein n=1 Tax=Tanacetum cinerariifolium TaxID=118510 RepID=A0A6L2LVL5_TANCI|nr:hypothetical protein [Tanacetum cinerariifolium]